MKDGWQEPREVGCFVLCLAIALAMVIIATGITVTAILERF